MMQAALSSPVKRGRGERPKGGGGGTGPTGSLAPVVAAELVLGPVTGRTRGLRHLPHFAGEEGGASSLDADPIDRPLRLFARPEPVERPPRCPTGRRSISAGGGPSTASPASRGRSA